MLDPLFNCAYFTCGTSPNKKNVFIDGISALNFQISSPYDINYALGIDDNSNLINAPQEIQISIERNLIQKENLFSYTGDVSIECFSIFNGFDRYYVICNAYLNSYSANISIGDIPKISTSFTSFGSELSRDIVLNSSPIESGYVDMPTINNIQISGVHNKEYFSKFNIYNISYQATIKRQPFYSVGDRFPVKVDLILPIEIKTTISSRLTAESYSAELTSYSNFTNVNLDFDILISGTGSNLLTLPIRRAKKFSESYAFSSDKILDFQHEFLGFYGI